MRAQRRTTLASEAVEILVGVLAKSDAAALPIRNWSGPNPGNVYTARQRSKSVGVAWESGGTDATTRQRMARALAALKRAKLVGVHRVRGSRYPSVRLTELGDETARRLCGLPGVSAGWWTMHRVAALTRLPRKARLLTDVWLSEVALCDPRHDGGYPTGAELSLVETLVLPALVHGWLAANSDIHGRVYFAATRAGRKALADEPPADDDVDPGAVDRQARELYRESLLAELDRFATAAPEVPREIGFVPLPVAMGDVAIGPWRLDVA
jgi:hypothetical protein